MLVVETTQLDRPYLDQDGRPMSANVSMLSRCADLMGARSHRPGQVERHRLHVCRNGRIDLWRKRASLFVPGPRIHRLLRSLKAFQPNRLERQLRGPREPLHPTS